MLKDKIYFIAGTGTDIGKTYFVEKIITRLRQKGYACDAIKPIISGFTPEDSHSDTARIITALGKKLHNDTITAVSPWRFKDPLSPNIAAKNEGCTIDFDEVADFCHKRINQAQCLDEFLFIEAAGGIMTPICDDKTFLDLAMRLQVGVLMLGGNYLGAISHGLCAIDVLKSRNIDVQSFIINDYPQNQAALAPDQTAQIITNISGVKAQTLDGFMLDF